MPFEGYKIYEEYERDKYKPAVRQKAEKVLAEAKQKGLEAPASDIRALSIAI